MAVLLLLLESDVVVHDQAIAITLDDISASVTQALNHDQSLAITLDGVTVVISQTATHSQSLAATLDSVTVQVAQTTSHSQSLAITLDDVVVSVAQVASHAQSLAVVLDGVAVDIAQSVAAAGNSQDLTITHGGIGHGSQTRKPRLIKIEEYESPAEVIKQIEAKYKEAVKKSAHKPKVTAVLPKLAPKEAPRQWLDYYEVMADNLATQREQQQIAALITMAVIKIAQESAQNEEDEMIMLLMAA